MIPVPKNKIREIVGPILRGQSEQYAVGSPEDVEHMLKSLDACFEAKTMFSYVDDLENPKTCLICGYHFSLMFAGTHISGFLLWVAPELRNTKQGFKKVEEMMTTLQDFGQMFQAKTVTVSSWLLGSTVPNSKKLWQRFGFESQELVLSKKLEY